jgi:hypothetical protein
MALPSRRDKSGICVRLLWLWPQRTGTVPRNVTSSCARVGRIAGSCDTPASAFYANLGNPLDRPIES